MPESPKPLPTRRHFCATAGAGLLVAGLPACDPGGQRIAEGAIDDESGATGGNGHGGGDGGTGGGQDLATRLPGDMERASSCTPGPISAGAASSYAAGGTPKHFQSGSNEVFVIRDSGGLFCVTAICPHQGCTINGAVSGFSCPCHGWTFDLNGGKTGSARSSLTHYAVCVDGSGNVTVDPNTTVSATQRY